MVADNTPSATHTLGEGTPRPHDRVADYTGRGDASSPKWGGRWLQMVADKPAHLQPH